MTDIFWKELNVAVPEKEKPKENLPAVQKEEIPKDEEKEADFDLARETMRDMITKGNDALDELIHLAKQDQSPRMFEVVATLIKTISDSAKDLQGFHEKKAKIDGGAFAKKDPRKSEVEFAPAIQVDKAVFVGRNVELIDQIKAEKKKPE